MFLQAMMIGLGGFLGAVSRFWVGKLLASFPSFSLPIATLTVNLLGSFLLGYIYIVGGEGPVYSLIGIGFCGAFTTFSTFKLENIQSMSDKKWKHAAAYMGISYIGGILMAFVGMIIGGFFM
ncbi:fluoride efflux transporter CrcB [Rossellomorea aquimaris]|uniref:fluoride efflux transporter CrcB n=1 Tax=Rossellomorea aquimaris TaxID=189382 RepID=UPI001CD50258|nr:fluoride efflux transporter CrcB [Rossellomorea aquimaris]MCA1053718.1 fluoride efflux transporter CrcB [Rossellomorea aquimaris]